MILNLGCGINRTRYDGKPLPKGTINVDKNPAVSPDHLLDLNDGFDFGESVADEIHAYHIIEHIGKMGEPDTWFRFWRDCWRTLKRDGKMYVVAPHWLHMDSIGDPTHTRLICRQTFTFLDRESYIVEPGGEGSSMTQFGIDFDMAITNIEEAPREAPRGIFAQLRARKTVDGGLVPMDKIKMKGVLA